MEEQLQEKGPEMKHSFWIKALVVLVAAALLPAVISSIAMLTSSAVNSAGQGLHDLVAGPFSLYGSSRMEALLKLCLWLVAIVLMAKFLFARRG